MNSVGPSDTPHFTPAQAHLSLYALIGTGVPFFGAGL